MTARKIRPKSVSIGSARWMAYATAGAATALVGVYSAEGAIHYSGALNITLNAAPGGTAQTYVNLVGQPAGNSLNPFHARLSSSSGATIGVAKWFMYGGVSGAVAGFAAGGFQYASRLNFGQGINSRPFVLGGGTMAYGNGYGNDQWLAAGVGFIGFRFDNGSGMQYGWAQVRMEEGAPGNSFTLIDYAYGDLGDMITAGQTTSIPEPGSLGLLAFGGLGLVAWRRQRAKAAAPQA